VGGTLPDMKTNVHTILFPHSKVEEEESQIKRRREREAAVMYRITFSTQN
jgi:hypothetical protein